MNRLTFNVIIAGSRDFNAAINILYEGERMMKFNTI